MSEEREEYRGKVFKSGNSVALRLPKGLGLTEGAEMRLVREAPMSFRAEPVDAPRRKIDISGFVGKAPWLSVPPREKPEERELDWDGTRLRRDG